MSKGPTNGINNTKLFSLLVFMEFYENRKVKFQKALKGILIFKKYTGLFDFF